MALDYLPVGQQPVLNDACFDIGPAQQVAQLDILRVRGEAVLRAGNRAKCIRQI